MAVSAAKRAEMIARQQQVRLLSEQGMPVREIAAQLGRPYHQICMARKHLAQRDPSFVRWNRITGKPWTAHEDLTLRDMYQRGRSIALIARELPGRTPCAVKGRVKALGLKRTAQHALSANRAAALLGVQIHAVSAWIKAGWLPAFEKRMSVPDAYARKRRKRRRQCRKRTGGRGRPWALQWTIETYHLHEFLADRRYWPLWSVATITDPALQQYARSVRIDDQWISVKEAARLLSVSTATVRQAIYNGRLPVHRLGHRHWLWRPDIVRNHHADL